MQGGAPDQSTQVIWEFIPDRRNYPPVIRSLIRQPPQRLLWNGSAIIFDGPTVHEAYPNRGPDGSQLFRPRRVKQRRDPIPMDDIVRISVYPIVGGFAPGSGSATRTRSTVVDVVRHGDGRTVAEIARILGIRPADEAALDAAVRRLAGPRWSPPGPDIFAGTLDEARLAEWPVVDGP